MSQSMCRIKGCPKMATNVQGLPQGWTFIKRPPVTNAE